MQSGGFAGVDSPLDPAYLFGAAGEAIILYDGEVGGLAKTSSPGRVQLTLSPKPSLEWAVEPDDVWYGELPDQVDLLVRLDGVDWTVPAYQRRPGRGWINSASFASPAAQLIRVRLQWRGL